MAAYEEWDGDDFDGEDNDPAVAALSRFASLIRRIDWFSRVGTPPDAMVARHAEDYLSSLGFPDIYVTPIDHWEDAAAAAESLDLNNPAWETEEQARATLIEDVVALYGEDHVADLLQPIEAVAVQVLDEAALNIMDQHRLQDEEIVRAAIGAAVQICHLAALVLLSGDEDLEDHPFFHKFRLFEAGHWPIGIAGSSFNLF
ncbi:MAG: hypothetical protein PVF65_02415 [Sphingomonadales bacterium]|jgi:hypothetical protein